MEASCLPPREIPAIFRTRFPKLTIRALLGGEERTDLFPKFMAGTKIWNVM